jgi:putative transposase
LLKISRSQIYYQRKQEGYDLQIKRQIEIIHLAHPAYGHKRVAIELGVGKNKVIRVMHKYGIAPPRRRRRQYFLTKSTHHHSYTNLIKHITPLKPNHIFASDLTYLKYHGKFVYLATIQDIFTREIVAAKLSDKHDRYLVLSTIKQAIPKHTPEYFHTDQGNEFMAGQVTKYLEAQGIRVSVSDKSSPWQNGYKESFFGRFKEENRDINRFDSLGELIEEIYSYIHYYNNLRIHTKLKMPPSVFKQKL